MEIVFRVLLIFVFVTAGLRFLGKRELSELSPQELVLLMLIPELATQGLNREDYSITQSLIGISTLLSLVFLSSVLSYRFKWFRKMMEPSPVVLYGEGKFRLGSMDRERVTAEEILGEARARGIEAFEDLKWAILESDGQISCIPYAPHEGRGRKKERNKI